MTSRHSWRKATIPAVLPTLKEQDAISFLNTHFNNSHTWSERSQLLEKVTTPKPTSDTERVFTFAIPYSRALETTNIARAIHEHENMLPPHLTDGEHLVAWKAASRLGSTITTYRYTSLDLHMANTPSYFCFRRRRRNTSGCGGGVLVVYCSMLDGYATDHPPIFTLNLENYHSKY
jgi:hypothetical protein